MSQGQEVKMARGLDGKRQEEEENEEKEKKEEVGTLFFVPGLLDRSYLGPYPSAGQYASSTAP